MISDPKRRTGRKGTEAPQPTRGPKFVRFFEPMLDALRELGGSATSGEVIDHLFDRLGIGETQQEETTAAGVPRLRNQIGWARFYLVKAGLIDSSRRGVWTLTDAGRKTRLDASSAYRLFKDTHRQWSARTPDANDDAEPEGEEIVPEGRTGDYGAELLVVLRGLPPAGFERVCQRLLRESGFQQVTVTGRSRDGGIDGHGVLEINPLVTFKVLFQCKRYGDGSVVTPSQVRDFRGAMMGRADKGLILTTGSFTSEARKEATRDGVPPIELVDGSKLVTMFERAELGLRPKRTFEVDLTFFDEFRH